MSIRYRVQKRNPDAVPPAAFSDLGTTAGLTYDAPPLGPGEAAEYRVTAYDSVTNLGDENPDARVTVRAADGGADLTGLPNAPVLVTAMPRTGGAVQVAWGYDPGGQGGDPLGFRVYVWPAAGSADYTTAAATAAYARGRTSLVTVTGLTGGTAYRAAVRAYNTAGAETNTASVGFTALSAGPTAVLSLTASATT